MNTNKSVTELEKRILENYYETPELARKIDNLRGLFVNIISSEDIQQQALELETDSKEKEQLLEDYDILRKRNKQGQIDRITRAHNELLHFVKEHPEYRRNMEKAIETTHPEKGAASKWINLFPSIHDHKPETITGKGILTRSKESYMESIRGIDKAYDSALRAEKKDFFNILRTIDDETYELILNDFAEADVDGLKRNSEVVSFNKVYYGRNKEDGKKVVVKATSNENKARIEAAANFYFSQHERLKGITTKGYVAEPVKIGGFYITMQEEATNGKEYDAHYYVAALATLHSHGKETLEGKIIVPEYKVREFQEVIEDISSKENASSYKRLKSQYEEAVHELKESNNVLLHGDAKKDNLAGGKLLDLENLKVGNPALDLSIFLAQSSIPLSEWSHYSKMYLDVIRNETGKDYNVEDVVSLTDQAKKASIVTAMREIRGLYGKRMGEKELGEVELLKSYLKEAA